MRKQSVFVVLSLGCVLLSFQNCSGGMQSQDAENFLEKEKRNTPEPSLDDLMMEKGGGGGGGSTSTSTATAAAAAVKPSCLASDLKFAWPVGGAMYKDTVIVNYPDTDRTAGTIKDYTGATGSAAATYDEHKGIDIAVPNFRYMDANFPVYASAAGVVHSVVEDQDDRHVQCSGEWNVVVIKHDNGFKSAYGHLKKNSVPVVVGQRVAAGTLIGTLGSSGCSNSPHVHFQVADCDGKMVDPMKPLMFTGSIPAYYKQAPMNVMDLVKKQPVITSIMTMMDPGADTQEFKADTNYSIGVTLSNAHAGDVLRIEFVEPSGAKSSLYVEHKLTTVWLLSHWYWNMYLHQPGVWKAQYKVNGVLQREQNLKIVP